MQAKNLIKGFNVLKIHNRPAGDNRNFTSNLIKDYEACVNP